MTERRRPELALEQEGVGEALWDATPLAALGLPEIPSELHFVRNHFPIPALDRAAWTLTVAGAAHELVLELDQLRALPRRSLRVVLECAGHRRSEIRPVAPGVPWGCGAVAEARWTGTSLAGVLKRAGVPADAIEVVLEGADRGSFSGLPGTHHFARSLPLGKALESDVLLAYEMNGEPIPVERGGPVRVIVPGWYATDSIKWVHRAWFSTGPFQGAFQAHDYLFREPGDAAPGRRMTELPVHALITGPTDREELPEGPHLVRGIAWGGQGGIARVDVRIGRGPWQVARLTSARGSYARVGWALSCSLDPGQHELACRALDGHGRAQPDVPRANECGYANNAIHRVRVTVASAARA